jgi:translation initiation factor 4G
VTCRRLDVPRAPELLGRLFGAAAAAGRLPLSSMVSLLEKTEGAEAKRGFGAVALKAVAAGAGGDDKLLAACRSVGRCCCPARQL